MIEVTFTDETSVTISSIGQWTTGNMLKVSGLSLNDKFTVSYSHSAMSITDFSVDRLGRTYDKYSVVPIPNRLFTETGTITVLFDEYSVLVPISSATKPDDYDDKYKDDTDTDACMIAELMSELPTKTSQLINDSGYLTSLPNWKQSWSGKCVGTNATITATVPTTAKAVVLRWYLNSYYSTLYLPKIMLNTTATKYIVSDETYYAGGTVKISGTTLTYVHTGQSNTSCYLDKVYYLD